MKYFWTGVGITIVLFWFTYFNPQIGILSAASPVGLFFRIAVIVVILVAIWGLIMRIVIGKTIAEFIHDQYQTLRLTKQVVSSLSEKNTLLETNIEELEYTKTAMLNVLEDLAQEKGESEKLRNRLKFATDIAHIGVWELDTVNRTLIWDEQMFTFFEIPFSESLTLSLDMWLQRLDPDSSKNITETISSRRKKSLNMTVSLTTSLVKGEKKFIKIAGGYQEGDKILGVATDVTQEVEIDKVKTEFVSLASHQLRTPLTSVSWYTSLLKDSLTNPSDLELLDEIERSAKRMAILVESLLNVSRIELGTFMINPQKMNIRDLISDIQNEFKSTIEQKKMTLNVTTLSTVSQYYLGDEVLLRIVLQNIISNALKYTRDNGVVSVKVLTKDKGETFGGKVMKQSVLGYKIEDNGIGIPKSEQKNIFTKLYRASNVKIVDTDGTGLGMYMTREILHRAGGDIWFTSVEDKGTIFYIILPKKGMVKKEGTKSLQQMKH